MKLPDPCNSNLLPVAIGRTLLFGSSTYCFPLCWSFPSAGQFIAVYFGYCSLFTDLLMNRSFHSDKLAICEPRDWTPAQLEDALDQLEANNIDLAHRHREPNDYLERLHYHLLSLKHQN